MELEPFTIHVPVSFSRWIGNLASSANINPSSVILFAASSLYAQLEAERREDSLIFYAPSGRNIVGPDGLVVCTQRGAPIEELRTSGLLHPETFSLDTERFEEWGPDPPPSPRLRLV